MDVRQSQFWSEVTFPLSEEPPLITPEDLESALLVENEHFLVFNKPGWMVCHPSKNGPWSSLVGAIREWKGLDRLHLVARLDRETSGIVVIARHRMAARTVQMAIERREVKKEYVAILTGEMLKDQEVNLPIGPDRNSPIAVRQIAGQVRQAQSALTRFFPQYSGNGYTLAKVDLVTGRKHQIRVHSEAISHPVLGDKIYGRQDTLYLDFIEKGVTEEMKPLLRFPRQALHCESMEIQWEGAPLKWTAPWPDEFTLFKKIYWPDF